MLFSDSFYFLKGIGIGFTRIDRKQIFLQFETNFNFGRRIQYVLIGDNFVVLRVCTNDSKIYSMDAIICDLQSFADEYINTLFIVEKDLICIEFDVY